MSVFPDSSPLAMNLPFIQLNWRLCREVQITLLCATKKKIILFSLNWLNEKGEFYTVQTQAPQNPRLLFLHLGKKN